MKYRRTERETPVERHLYDEVRKLGGWSIKLFPIVMVGLPDRMVLLPGALIYFVELKRAVGGRKGSAQKRWRERLRDMGFFCEFISGREEVDRFIRCVIECHPHLKETT